MISSAEDMTQRQVQLIDLERRMLRIRLETDHYLLRLGAVDFHCPQDAQTVSRLRWVNSVANEFSVHIVTTSEAYVKEAALAIRAWDRMIHKIITLSWKVRAARETSQDAQLLCQATLERLQSNVENAVERYRRRLIRRRRCMVPSFTEEIQEKYLIEKFRKTFSGPADTCVQEAIQQQGGVCRSPREDAPSTPSTSGKFTDCSVTGAVYLGS